MNKNFEQGFEKKSGLLQRATDKLRGLFTGKEYLYHGTASKNIPSILEKGILPGFSKDTLKSTEHAKGLTFLAKDKDYAKMYGEISELMANPKAVKASLASRVKSLARKTNFIKNLVSKIPHERAKIIIRNSERIPKKLIRSIYKERDLDVPHMAMIALKYGDKKFLPKNLGGVIKVEIPKNELVKIKTINPEFTNTLLGVTHKKSINAEIPIRSHVDKKFIKGVL